MATSANSPTNAETDVSAGVTDGDTPQVADPANEDFVRQNPQPASDEEEVPPLELMDEAAEDSKAEAGSVYAKYVGGSMHERGLTPEDQIGLGVPQDKVLHDGGKFTDSGGTTHDRPGLWWTQANRFRLNVTDAHPALLQYLEEDDPNFEVKRF